MYPPHRVPLDEAQRGEELLQLADHAPVPFVVAVVSFSDEHTGREHACYTDQVGQPVDHPLL